jgi:hypothetical protein
MKDEGTNVRKFTIEKENVMGCRVETGNWIGLDWIKSD